MLCKTWGYSSCWMLQAEAIAAQSLSLCGQSASAAAGVLQSTEVSSQT